MENRTEEARYADGRLRYSQPVEFGTEWFDSVLRSSGVGMIVTDADGSVQFVNEAAERLIEMSAIAAEGRPLRDVVRLEHRDGTAVAGDLVKLAIVGDAPVSLGQDLVLGNRHGQLTQVEGEVSVRREAGELAGTVLTLRDVSTRKAEEWQRQEEQKMRIVAQLAGTVAHELNNRLMVIIGNAEALEDEFTDSASARDASQSIQRAGRDIAKMMRQLLTLSHREVLQPQPVKMDALIEKATPKAKSLLPPNIDLSTSLNAGGGTLLIDPGQMEQAVVDLVGHCRDRMPDGGKIEIITRRIVVDDGLRGRHLRRFSELVVTDSGPSLRGLPVEVLFEPTWVTAPGRPTGLGLFALRTLVAAARGHFAIESPAETGARFVVRLPELEEEILAPELTAEESGKPTILLVEDDDGVRVLLHNALAKRGYRVIEARNGEEALMQSEICEANIDLLITDVVMPKMNGPTLARELIQTRPNTKMLLISGAPDDVGDVQELVKLGAHFMLKPFSQRELANRVDAVLNGQA